ncbi:MAG: hypothetical protein U0354_20325 [Candidatus Sericytochromatia bacterium]
MSDYKEAWLQKAKIDYFAPFISLWLACNSWYRSHYSELNNQDRTYINKLKEDFTKRNHLFQKFEDCLLGSDEKKKISFKTNLELLHYSLNRAELKPEKLIFKCSLNKVLIDYSKKDIGEGYVDVIAEPKINSDRSVHKSDENNVIKLDTKFIISDTKIVFSGLFELIYQVRNMVIHGHVKPEKDEHEVVKYCYLILSDLMGL